MGDVGDDVGEWKHFTDLSGEFHAVEVELSSPALPVYKVWYSQVYRTYNSRELTEGPRQLGRFVPRLDGKYWFVPIQDMTYDPHALIAVAGLLEQVRESPLPRLETPETQP